MMVWSTERTPTPARSIAKTETTLKDCTSAIRNVPVRKASSKEFPVFASMPRNQGCPASGAAASFTRTRPTTIMAPPRKDAATFLWRDSRPLAIAMPATPSRWKAASLMFEGSDHDQCGNADAATEDQDERVLGRDQSRAQDAQHDEGQGRHALGD